MAKRFTDTDLWDKEWFMTLSLKHKCLIRFLFDKCDAAGVWSANWILASQYIGEPVTVQDLEALSDRILNFAPGKFYVLDFIEFQYGTLSEKCKPHLKVISLLEKYGLSEAKIKGYTKGIQSLEEKEEDKEEEKEEEKDEGGLGETKDFALEILNDFGFTELKNYDKLRTVNDFLKIIKNSGRLEYFRSQYLNYHLFKNRYGERKHGFSSFFGKQENRFEDGKWDEANWGKMIEDFEVRDPKKDKPSRTEQILDTFNQVNNAILNTANG